MLKKLNFDGTFVTDFVMKIGSVITLGNKRIKRIDRIKYAVKIYFDDGDIGIKTMSKKEILDDLPRVVNSKVIMKTSRVTYTVDGVKMRKSGLLELLNKQNTDRLVKDILYTMLERKIFIENEYSPPSYMTTKKDLNDVFLIRANSIDVLDPSIYIEIPNDGEDYFDLSDLINQYPCELLANNCKEPVNLHDIELILADMCSMTYMRYQLKKEKERREDLK